MLLAALLTAAALMAGDPRATDVAHALAPPGPQHWFGTDQLGRDVFARVVAATWLDLAIAAAAVAASATIGTLAGAAAGFAGGAADRWAGRAADLLLGFPLFVVAMLLAAALGQGPAALIAATTLVNLPFYLRLSRDAAALLRDAAFVRAARLGGSGEVRVLFRVILPNMRPMLAVQASLNLGWALLNAAALSFLGVGVRPPVPEWGIMAQEGAPFLLTGEWWVAAFPCVALAVAVLAFHALGDRARDALDPRRG